MEMEIKSGKKVNIPLLKTGGAIIAVLAFISSCSIVPTGAVGVKTTFGQIDPVEETAGVVFKAPFVTRMTDYNVRETSLDLKNLTPKAKDNLSLKDLDVSIYYEVEGGRVAEMLSEYIGQTQWSDSKDAWLPGSGIVYRLSREAIYDTISQMDSLTIHQRRSLIVGEVKNRLQKKLDGMEKGTFRITNVVIRAITTDPSIEKSIQSAVKAQKRLEQMAVQTEIAEKQAEIKVTEARGIAESNRIINSSLTREYLQHEANKALMLMANKGANTVVVPANMATAPLINIK